MEMPLMSAVQDGVTRDSVARTLAVDEFVDAFSRIPPSVDLPVTNHVVHSISSALPRSPFSQTAIASSVLISSL